MIIGRETEKEFITRFFKERINSKKGGALYISGNPGTGKTAVTEEISKQLVNVTYVRN